MDLTRIELLRLKAADGVATEDERAELAAAGIAAAGWDPLRAAVQGALSVAPHPDLASGALADAVLAEVGLDAAAGPRLRAALAPPPAPDVADAVLAALALEDPAVGPVVRAALDAGPAPELADSVLGALGLSDGVSAEIGAALHEQAGPSPELAGPVLDQLGAADDVGAALRAALQPGAAPDVADAVMAALGAEAAAPVGEALAASAGPAPDLWADVAARIGAEESAAAPAVEPAAPVVSLEAERAARRRWVPVFAGLAAAAAAVVLAIGLPGDSADPAPFDYELAAVNEVEIEDISVGDDAIVQVLQFEEDAPTIIFIDVAEEPDPALGDEGATL